METITTFLTSLGDGIAAFLPDVAKAGVDTVDTIILTSEGQLTTVAMLMILGIATSLGLGVWGVLKKKVKKI